MGIDMHEEARKIGQLTGEMSCTLQGVWFNMGSKA
ncbi:hypothetical protein CPAL_08620 [Clostridium thermopalmarium DSM 5974]|uniref:Uncharacterized protein n=1 Tax=Clostridium thermopalmarium DSM 5974 TaxID=1121340 RepID=A0A2T0AV99_9CLOT|nr:hypothetical protein CPAL_08620 [Clostridium thermopalmarium DSM 5974]